MAKGGGTPTQTTEFKLSPEQQQMYGFALPYLKSFAAQTPERYGGSTIAGFNPNQTGGQQQVLDATGQMAGVANSAAGANQFITGGNFWDPQYNPALQGTIDATTRPIVQNYQEKILPGIRSDAISSGNFGGSRQGVAEGIAARDVSTAIGDTAAKTTEDLYKTNIDAQLKAMGLAPVVQGALTAPGQAQSAVGDVQQAMSQAQLNELVQNFFADRGGLDFAKAKDILGLISGMPGGQTVSTGSVPQPNMAMSTLGGAASGAALGSAIMPGIGTGIGAAGGALLPWLFK
jgi:hypothetical protein